MVEISFFVNRIHRNIFYFGMDLLSIRISLWEKTDGRIVALA